MRYPALFTPAEEGGFVVEFRDVPEAITQGDTEAEASTMASDVLLTCMKFYIDDNRPVPMPTPPLPGERLIDVPLSVVAKILLLNEMFRQKIGPSELARRMGTSKQEANRLTDLSHSTKIDRIGDAIVALGRRLDLVIRR